MSGASTSCGEKDKDSHWYFTAEQLANSPSRRHGIDADQELTYRQITAYLIQEMGQRLQVSQLCINTAIVYMHRFYAFHSFTHFHRNNIAAASLFLAAKVEEQPQKLERVIRAANKCLNQPTPSSPDASYIQQAQEIVFSENILLQTLGFDVAIDHPHTHVVKTCHLVKACKDLAQTSYFLASNSLHLTSMCLQYRPTVVACFCIYLACKWSRWEIPQSTEGKHWFHYVDKTVTMDLLKQLTDEFIAIYEKSPSRLKSKLKSIKVLAQAGNRDNKDKKMPPEEWKMVDMMKLYGPGESNISQSLQSSAYSSSSSSVNDQPSASTPSFSLLPPPPPPQPQQLMRKGDVHPSQHRGHHNLPPYHAKPSFPSGDMIDHKSSHKQQQQQQQQQPFGGNLVHRPRDHAQSSQSHPASAPSTNSSRINIPTSSGRSSSGMIGQSAPRQSTQSHQMDMNYHKSREKGNLSNSFLHPAPHAGHKMTQKPDSSRVISKDPTAKVIDQTKMGSNKMFAPSSIGVSQYGGNQHSNGPQANSKLESGHDMPRGMLHNQRPYGINNGPAGVPQLGYQAQLSRQSGSGSSNSNSSNNNNSSSSNNNNSNKHDPTKQMSVHLQPQHYKQSIPSETTYGASVAHEPQQQQTQHTQHTSNYPHSRSSASDILATEDSVNPQYNAIHGMVQQQSQPLPQTKQTSSSSVFSPGWNEKLQQNQSLIGVNYNNSSMSSASGDTMNYKLSSNTNTKDSPKRVEQRDRMLDANAKKDKNRSSHLGMDSAGIRAASTQQTIKPAVMPKKLDPSSNLNELAGTSMSLVAGVKRPIENIALKVEEDLVRDNKMRKLDNVSTMPYMDANKPTSDLGKLQVMNGIETNPDLIRSLLRDANAPSAHPPAELLDPTAYKSNIIAVDKEQSAMDVTESSGSKAEKKKKKEKHKHKEKDKSKDREERKKHKKEKDRHKDRDRESDSSEHVKIKITKEKLECAANPGESLGFKIKIPKDRIIGDINTGSGSGSGSGGATGHGNMSAITTDMSNSSAHTPALKIKISKDKLEHYSSGSSDIGAQIPQKLQSSTNFYSIGGGGGANSGSGGGPNMPGISTMGAGGMATGISHSSGSGSSSSKKKERDRDKERDREKDKKRNIHDLAKSNGNNGPMQLGASGLMSVPIQTTTTKSQNSSKFKESL